jgi:hypothetical protein
MNDRKSSNVFIPQMGDVILECSESLKAYATYCSNYPTAMQMVQNMQMVPETKDQIMSWMNAPECRGLSLESFLVNLFPYP